MKFLCKDIIKDGSIVNKNKNVMAQNTPQQFYSIPLKDLFIGAYAAYYVGLAEEKGQARCDFNFRAINHNDMIDALKEAFTQENAPWVLIDHRYKKDSNGAPQHLHGAHFITLYHKTSQQIVIAMPGFEPHSPPAEILRDLNQVLIRGVQDQSKELFDYAHLIQDHIKHGQITCPNGDIYTVKNKKPLICAHSMGTIAGQMMALLGYKTILFEPRPVHDTLLKKLNKNMAAACGVSLPKTDMLARLNANCINIRARHANTWNSLIAPWKTAYPAGITYSYCNNQSPRLIDRFITTLHRLECVVPSLLDTPTSRLAKLYNGKMSLRQHTPAHYTLLDDIIENSPENSSLRRIKQRVSVRKPL